ncbi:hypothetical protein Calag_0866 [Caldisphaera lagunensis DSM 15908]|uniref:N-glycosylase/DNA lyase n=1 Tax=Caldisphaera lagunensis (strain DSM 15908 / JCM 11604 / ANMR 0165 / IC-154) TaxID=1056495 RepID=L0A9S8_CALLD|nr:hypothetical protein Calag_0866 [Caldisphaera lagunensis DSM 15908]
MVKLNINNERLIKVSDSIKNFGLDNVLILEEKLDPQFDYIQKLKEKVGKNYATIYSLLVSLISYKLTMKGEDWWKCFSEYLSAKDIPKNFEESINNVINFINDCKGSIIGRAAKIKRIEKVVKGSRDILLEILERPEVVLEKPNKILEEIAKSLNSKEWKKTITFSIKMSYYAIKNRGELRPLNIVIPMPIDVRISCISYTSGIIESNSYKEILKKPKIAIEAWDKVSQLSNIPQIHLDSLLWIIGRNSMELSLDEAKENAKRILMKYFDKDKVDYLLYNLFYRECK